MMVNAGMICFHKNASSYPRAWIEDYVNSFFNQTVEIPVYECNYGNTNERLFPKSKFFKKQFPNHVGAHNFLCDEMCKDGFSYIFNSNCDDIMTEDRVERQLEYCKKGFDIISSNHSIIDGENNILTHDIQFSKMDVGLEMSKNHNIVSHPSVVYSKNFWTHCPKLNPDLIPTDDMELWKWALFNGYKFVIVPQTLLYYRKHSASVSAPRQK